MIQYEIQCNETYFKDHRTLTHKLQEGRWWFLPIKSVCSLILLLGLGFCLYRWIWQGSIFFGILLLIILSTSTVERLYRQRQYKKTPHYLQTFTCQLSEESIIFISTQGQSIIYWHVFSKIYDAAEGFLLYDNQQRTYWLPHHTIIEGNKAGAAALFQQKIPNFITL